VVPGDLAHVDGALDDLPHPHPRLSGLPSCRLRSVGCD